LGVRINSGLNRQRVDEQANRRFGAIKCRQRAGARNTKYDALVAAIAMQ
jgi:hypothetical protein